jgi:hypothetical protein
MGCNHFITQSNERTIQHLLWGTQAAIGFARIRFSRWPRMKVKAFAPTHGPAKSTANMPRYIDDLGDRARNGGPGLGLTTIQIHPEWADRHQFF